MKQEEATSEKIKFDNGNRIYINKDSRAPYIENPVQENQRYANIRARHACFLQQRRSYLPTRNGGKNEVAEVGEGKRNNGMQIGDKPIGREHNK